MTLPQVSFTRMEDGTQEDYLLLAQHERAYGRLLPDRVLNALARLDHSMDGYQVTRLEHSLQTATRAEADGADDDMVLGALLHDIGDDLAFYNHSEVATAILRPYVRAEVIWVVEHHGLFQNYFYVHHLGGDRNARDRHRDHPFYRSCVDFCARWDQAAFDPAYPTKPLGHFEPLVRRVLGRPHHDPRYIG